jgi:hypothetical protein
MTDPTEIVVGYLWDNLSLLDETHLVAAWKLNCATKNLRNLLTDRTTKIDDPRHIHYGTVHRCERMSQYLQRWFSQYISEPQPVYIPSGLTLIDTYDVEDYLYQSEELVPDTDDVPSNTDEEEEDYNQVVSEVADTPDEYVQCRIPVRFDNLIEGACAWELCILEIRGIRLPLPARLFEFFGSYDREICFAEQSSELYSVQIPDIGEKEFALTGRIAWENDIYNNGCWAIAIDDLQLVA